MLVELGLEALEQGESIGRSPGKAGQHLAVVELAHLARRAFDHDVAQGDLAVAADGDLDALRGFAPHAEDGCAVILFHSQAYMEALTDFPRRTPMNKSHKKTHFIVRLLGGGRAMLSFRAG